MERIRLLIETLTHHQIKLIEAKTGHYASASHRGQFAHCQQCQDFQQALPTFTVSEVRNPGMPAFKMMLSTFW